MAEAKNPQDPPQHEQGEGRHDRDLGVQVPAAEAQPPDLAQHQDHGEAQRSDEHPQADREQDQPHVGGVGEVGDQAVGVRGEAAVVEGRDRVEDPVPRRGVRRLPLDQEAEREDHRQRALDDDRGQGHGAQQRADLAETPDVHGVLRHELGAQPELAPDGQGQDRGHGQRPETADLHGDQDDELPGEGPVIGGRHHGQPRDRDGRGGGEGRVDEARGAPVVGGPRQPQQDREQRRHGDEDEHGQAGGGGLGQAVHEVAQAADPVAKRPRLGLGRTGPEGGTHRGTSRSCGRRLPGAGAAVPRRAGARARGRDPFGSTHSMDPDGPGCRPHRRASPARGPGVV